MIRPDIEFLGKARLADACFAFHEDDRAAALHRIGEPVDVAGAVVRPGLHRLRTGDRIRLDADRGEAHHQLRRAIAYAHGGRFRVRSQHEQEVWNECARLVGNAVIYYNSLILSEALGEFEQRGDLASAEVLKHVSPVAWLVSGK